MNANSLYKRVELLANAAIVVLAVMLGVVLVKNHLLDPVRPTPDEGLLRPGAKLPLPGVDWKGNGRTVVLAVASTCPYCTASAPFYQRMERERGQTRLVIFTPEPADVARQYLSGLGVSFDEVRQVPLNSVGIRGTPTLIVVDDTGSIVNSWVGKLRPAQEDEVLAQLRAPVLTSAAR